MYVFGDVQASHRPATVLVVSWHSKVTGSSLAVRVKLAVEPSSPTAVAETTGAVVSSPTSGGFWPWVSGAETAITSGLSVLPPASVTVKA